MKYTKKLTVKEWAKFETVYSAETVGNDYQFFNFFTQRYESYDYLTGQEILLHKYKIILTDHKNSFRAGKMIKVPLKEKIKSLPGKITIQNFDEGMKVFNKGMQDFGDSMDKMTRELGGDKAQQKKNLDMLWGKKKPVQKKESIFGNWKAQPKRRKKKLKSQDEANLEKLWGKKKPVQKR